MQPGQVPGVPAPETRRAVDIGCSCKNKGKRETFKIKLPGGLTVTKNSQAEATAYAAKHPGSVVTKVPARA